MDSKAECDQLNLAHETKTNKRPAANCKKYADGHVQRNFRVDTSPPVWPPIPLPEKR